MNWYTTTPTRKETGYYLEMTEDRTVAAISANFSDFCHHDGAEAPSSAKDFCEHFEFKPFACAESPLSDSALVFLEMLGKEWGKNVSVLSLADARKYLNLASLKISQATIGVITRDEMHLVLHTHDLEAMAAQAWYKDYMKQGYLDLPNAPKRKVVGRYREFDVPLQLWGSALHNDLECPRGTAFLLSQCEKEDGIEGVPSFSTMTLFKCGSKRVAKMVAPCSGVRLEVRA